MISETVTDITLFAQIRSRTTTKRKPRETPTPLHDKEFLALHMALNIVTECKASNEEIHDLVRRVDPVGVGAYELRRRGEEYTPKVAGERLHKATYIHRQRFVNPEIAGVHAEILRYLPLVYKWIKRVEEFAVEELRE